MRLERLTFVHHGDQGTIGRLIAEARGVLRFGGEHSSLMDLAAASPTSVPGGTDQSVRIQAVPFSALPPEVRKELGEEQVPCVLGHSGVTTVTLLTPRACSRVAASISDLRGKVRYGVARVGWEI